ncbi:MAG: hypothetical protein ACNA71_08610 [Kiritimatiellia bacterium]
MKDTIKEHACAGQNHLQGLRFYHPSPSGHGSAMQLEPRFSNAQGDRYNCFFLELAAQKSTSGRAEGKRVHATFNWKEKVAVKLEFADICEILVVLEGKVDKAGNGRGGLYHQNGAANTIITCQKNEGGGYLVGLSRKDGSTGETNRVSIVLREAEALGLRHVLQSSLFFLSFHQHLFRLWALRSEG